MRVFCCVLLMLTACTSHAVRCDKHLQRINPPSAGGPGTAGRTP